jgi:hypothetical protein
VCVLAQVRCIALRRRFLMCAGAVSRGRRAALGRHACAPRRLPLVRGGDIAAYSVEVPM